MKTTTLLAGLLYILLNEIDHASDLPGSVTNRYLGDLPLVAAISFYFLLAEGELNYSVL